MTKFDLGTITSFAAGLLTVLAAAAAYAKDWLLVGLGKIKTSFVALVSSPAVWLAVGVTFLGGFWAGHIQGAHGKRALRSEVVTLRVAAENAELEAASAEGRAKASSTEGKKWKDKAEALEAEVSALRARVGGKSSPVAAVSRRPVPKVPVAQPAVSKPFWPFN